MSEEGKTTNGFLEWSSGRGPLPSRNEGENCADYFRRLMSEWSFRAEEAAQVHEQWKRRLKEVGGPRESDCKRRLFFALRELMDSGFLRSDYIDTGMPQEDCERALEELRELGFEQLCQKEGADWKFALLTRHLRKQGESRVMIDERMAGFYIDEMREQISDDAAEAFFRFTTFIRLAYQELDNLNAAKPKPKNKGADLSPEQEAVNDFVDKIIRLVNVVYDKHHGKMMVPGVRQAEVKVVVLRDDLINKMEMDKAHKFDDLKEWCYPVDGKSKEKLCQYVLRLYRKDYFGRLPKNKLSEELAPIVGLKPRYVANLLSEKKSS